MRRLYEILGNNPRPGDVLARAISICLLVLIGTNVLASVLESEESIYLLAPRFFTWFEWASVAVFTIEYLLRLWSCVTDPRYAGSIRGRLRLMLSPMALVDLVAIAPFYLELIVPNVLDLRFLRALRLLRMFRLLRIDPLAEAFATVMRVLTRKRTQLFVSFAVVLVAILLSAGAIYVTEHGQPDTRFTSIPHAMWWSIVTITTIGYGDMVPTTAFGKFLGGLVSFVGICAVALPVGIISSGFIEEVNRKHRAAMAATAAQSATLAAAAADAAAADAQAAAEAARNRSHQICPHCGNDLDAPPESSGGSSEDGGPSPPPMPMMP
jgi:voltage-gated potassium channel